MVVESICDITIFGEFFKFELLFQKKIMILIAQTPTKSIMIIIKLPNY